MRNFQEQLYRVGNSDMERTPFRFIGRLDHFGTRIRFMGTGILISPNLVLSCAHNCSYGLCQKNFDIVFLIQRLGVVRKYKVESCFFPPQFKASKREWRTPLKDYALLKLQNCVEGEDDFIQLNDDISVLHQQSQIGIFGYPQKQQIHHRQLQIALFGRLEEGRIREVNKELRRILYEIPTQIGFGGSPILHFRQNKLQSIVGIHKGIFESGQDTSNECKFGCLITPDILEILFKEATKLEAIMFKTEYFFKKAQQLFNKEQYQQAVVFLEKAARTSRNQAIILAMFSTISEIFQSNINKPSQLNEKLQINDQFSILASLNKKRSQVYEYFGHEKLKQNKVSQGREYLEESLKFNDKNVSIYYSLSRSYLISNQTQKGIMILKKGIQANPENSDLHTLLGNALKRVGNVSLAIKQYEHTIKLDKKCYQAHNNLGNAYMLQKQWEKACLCFNQCLQINRNCPQALNNLAVAYKKMNHFALAEKTLSKILELNPKSDIFNKNMKNFQRKINIVKKKEEKPQSEIKKEDDKSFVQ